MAREASAVHCWLPPTSLQVLSAGSRGDAVTVPPQAAVLRGCKLLQGARALLYMPLAVIIGSRCPPHAYAEV
jgi:hypothetical protein